MEIVDKVSIVRTYETSDFSMDNIIKFIKDIEKESGDYLISRNIDIKNKSIQISKIEITKLDSTITLCDKTYVPTLESYKEPTKKYNFKIDFDILKKID